MRGWSRIGVLLLALAFAPAVAGAQQTRNFRVGLYFDADAESCVTTLRNFSTVRVYAFGFLDPGTQVNGVILRLELQPHFRALTSTVKPPKNALGNVAGDLTGSRGLDLTLQQCIVADTSPLELFSFQLDYLDTTCQECQAPNVVLELAGGIGATDSTASIKPRVKLCPDDPIGGHGELVEAASLRATLNCTANCPCTLSVQPRSWAEIKRLYREP